MAEAVSIPSAELIQEFLTEKGREVIKKMFYGFESAQMVRKFDGVTDKLDLAEQDVTVSLIKEWNSSLGFTDDAIEIRKVRLEVAEMKTELKFVIKGETLRAYKAYLKGAGLVADDFSLIDYLLMQPQEKQMEELEDAMWQGEEQSSGIGTRTLLERVNGYRTIAKQAGVDGDATVVTTGSIDNTNAVTKVQQMYKAAHKTFKKKGVHIYCSYTLFEAYQEHLLSLHNNADLQIQEVKGMGYTLQGIPLRIGARKSMLIPVAGMGDDDGLIATRAEFLAYGFDYESEQSEWDIQKHGWETWALNAFPVGFQILLKKPGFLLVNDQL
ncbi:MAG: hypothetical protein E6R03_17175 [Hyphomicrobiaceae bacterium]|nr:MAG: hypothetical protein E6R03_17175 [Hyphomicrobiaceae bacterium]